MKRIMCYCLAISMIQRGSTEMGCTEPQLLVKEMHCAYDNVTSLSMFTFNEESIINLTESLLYGGCDIEFNQPYVNNSFYIECEVEEVNCGDDSVKVGKEVYHVECEEVNLLGNNSVDSIFNDTDLTHLPIYNKGNSSVVNEINVTYTPNNVNDSSSEFDVSTKETTIVHVTSTDAGVNTPEIDLYSNEATVTQVTKDVTDGWSEFDEFNNTEISTASSEADDSSKRKAGAFGLEQKKKEASDSNILAILGYSAAVLGATVGMAFGAYKLKNLLQSGTYLLPDSPSPPGFIELA